MEELQFIVPKNIKLIFENEQLNIMKVLILLQVLRDKSKKRFYKIEDIVFYYSLVNFNLIKILDEDINNLMKNRNIYLRFNKSINQIILELSNLEYIDIKGNISCKKDRLGVRMNEEGERFLKPFNSEYFLHLKEEYENVITNIENNLMNKNKVKGLLK
ncbi:hypothetical protein ACQR24_01490 [Clostridium perfringens]|nr:hypothetical protein [Clostridium perfringens]